MAFRNIKNFKRFLDENLKNDFYDLEAVCEDLELAHRETGLNEYELPRHLTKSGNPECFSYEVEDTFYDMDGKEIPADEIGDNDYDTVETTFIF